MASDTWCSYYDDPEFDYRSYWQGRDYEDIVEKKAITYLYQLIGPQQLLVDLGGGFGRLVPIYHPWVQKAILVEPSSKIIKETRLEAKKWPNLHIVQNTAETLCLQPNSVDVVQMIRVAHHCLNLPLVFQRIHHALKDQGWFILEFPNKIHALKTLHHWLQRDWQFRSQTDSIDRRSSNHQSAGTIPFMNHHPQQILDWLTSTGFNVTKCLSVSNLRRLNFLPLSTKLNLDQWFWPLTQPIWWGPSVFVLAQKA